MAGTAIAIGPLGMALWAAPTPVAAVSSPPYMGYVTNSGSNTVTPFNTATRATGTPIPVGLNPVAVAITPDAGTAYVVNKDSGTVTPIDTVSNTAGTPITVGTSPAAIAITPDGATAYVANSGSNTVTPITLATNTAGTPIPVGSTPSAIAISPDGTKAYVADSYDDGFRVIDVATNTAGTVNHSAGWFPNAVAITPDGQTLYFTNGGDHRVTAVNTSTWLTTTIDVAAYQLQGVAVTPDGHTAYVTSYSGATVIPINTSTQAVGTPIDVVGDTWGIAITPDGVTGYTTHAFLPPSTGWVNPFDVATNWSSNIQSFSSGGVQPTGIAITPDQAPVAHLSVTPWPAGVATQLDASASTVRFTSIASYRWNFGDGSPETTTTSPTTSHVYASVGTYTASVTETSSTGTTTTTADVFTGQTLSRNGGPQAQTQSTFTVTAPPVPTVTGVSPASGPAIGGTAVTITGSGFYSANAVSFGANPAPSFSASDDTHLTAVSPAGSGTVDVTVGSVSGTSSTSAADHFTYAAPASHLLAYVTNSGGNTVTPFDTVTNTFGAPITVGTNPVAVAITPDASTAYVANMGDSTVSVIDTATNHVTATLYSVGVTPVAVAITPDGSLALVASSGSNTVTPITVAGNVPGTPIAVGTAPDGIAITPDGTTAYVANSGDGTVTPITVATRTPGTPISVGTHPEGIAITPDGSMAYVANGGGTVTPITVATGTTGTAISLGSTPHAIAITPDGTKALVSANSWVKTITLATSAVTTVSGLYNTDARGITVAPGGTTAYLINHDTSYNYYVLWPISIGSNAAGSQLILGSSAWQAVAVTPDQAPVAALSVNAKPVGMASGFDASLSTVEYGSITAYTWDFGDGTSPVTTATATTTHTYTATGTYTATVTEKSSAGTSTTQVFTGQTMSRNGGPQAQTSSTFSVGTVPVPTVTGLSPSSGAWTGATSVTISGSGFTFASAVHFGLTAASSFSITNDGEISAVSPPGSGTVDVTVTTSAGTSATGASDLFTYIPPPAPTVTGVSPSSGPAVGGTAVTITGTGFVAISAVSFGGTPAASFTVTNATHIAAVSPARSGTVDVTVANLGGTSATGAADLFTYGPAVHVAYVGNGIGRTISPIDTVAKVVGAAMPVAPAGLAITPDGRTLYATFDEWPGYVRAIDIATGQVTATISGITGANRIAIAPDGQTAYVLGLGWLWPIDVGTNTAGTPVAVNGAEGIAITPDGQKAYITGYWGTVTPVDLTTRTPGTDISIGGNPSAIAITPDGLTALVTDANGNWVTPIDIPTGVVGTHITVDWGVQAIAITPDGSTAFVTSYYQDTVTAIDVSTHVPGTPIAVGSYPTAIAVTPDGKTAYVGDSAGNTVTPVDVATRTAGAQLPVGSWPYAVAITPDQAPVAHLSVTPAPPGSATTLDASASTVAIGSIASYKWSFGDGTPVETTATPTTTHVYAATGDYTASVTETSSAGTSMLQVFTGQTVSRNGGPQAQAQTTVTIGKAGTTTSVTPASPTTVYGQAQLFTATVTGASGAPTGTVQFTVDGSNYGSAQTLDSGGAATLAINNFPPGGHIVAAGYSGDDTYLASSAGGRVWQVNKASTSVTVSSDTNPADPGVPVTFSATVTPVSPGAGQPTGWVIFWISGAMNMVPLHSDGTATFTTSTLTPGTHSVVADYRADDNFYGNYSPTLSQVITATATTTAVDTSDATAVTGQPLTFTATVTPTIGSGTPTGTVQFSVDGTAVGSPQTMSGGAASISGVALTHTGSPHTIGAAYSGGGGFAASSGSYTQTVDRADTAVAVVSSANPSVFGQAVSFTATVSAASPGGGTPGGTVQFYVNGSPLGSPVTLNGLGQATSSSVSSLDLSGGSVEADYSGSADHNAGTGTVTQIVNQSQSATSVALNVEPSVVGQAVTFTATVVAKAPGAGTPTGTVQFSADSVSIGSPVALDGSGHATSAGVTTLALGSHSISAVYSGDTHFGSSTAAAVTQHVGQAQTSVSVLPDPPASVYGQYVQIIAEVSVQAPGAGTPTGSVEFFDGATSLGTDSLNGSGSAAIDISTLTAGAHNLTAVYSGDGNFESSTSAPWGFQVNPASTATVVSSAQNPSRAGDAVTFTATVTTVAPGAGTPAGALVWKVNGVAQEYDTLDSAGTATFGVIFPHAVSYSVEAVYAGNASFAGSGDGLTQVVEPAYSTPYLTSSLNPSVYGQSVTFSADVRSAWGVTGTVAFTLDGDTYPAVPLEAGSTAAVFDPQAALGGTLPAGDHSVVATYSGDADHLGSTSLTLIQTVDKAPSSGSVTTTVNPSVYGEGVAVIAQVSGGTLTRGPSPLISAVGTPTGSVQFLVDGSPFGPVEPLIDGIAAYGPDHSLSTGAHSIVAVYGGDLNFEGSTSPGYAQQVNPADTSTTLASFVNPSVVGQVVSLQASVTPVAPGAGMPTGSVTFYDGATPLGPAVSLDGSGNASTVTSSLTAGAHSITAVYAGDGNFQGGTSNAVSQQVDPADTTMVVTASANPSTFSHSVTFTASVAAVAPGGGTVDDGTVQWTIDGTPVAVVPVNTSGQATLAIGTLTAGSHTVAADYSGCESYNASGDSLTQVVNSAVTVTALSSSANPSLSGQSITFTAHVTGDGTPTGTVQFAVEGVDLGTPVAINATGYATSVVISTLAVGGHYVDADYSGDANHLTSEGGITQTVSKASASVNLASSLNPSKFGQSVTFTATVAAVAPASGTPTGTVTFKVGGTTYKVVTLSGGVATYTTNGLPPGTLSVTAAYSGDTAFNTATGNTVSQVVNFSSNCITTQVKSGLVVNSGQAVCVQGTPNKPVSVKGGITVRSGGALFISNATVQGGIVSTGAAGFRMCNSTEGSGSITITGSTGMVVVGDKGDDGTPVCGNNTISGGLTVTGNTGGVEVGGNTVSGGVTVSNNTGAAPPDATATEIEGNTISGGLYCSGNSPAPVNGGFPNRVTSGVRTDQCAAPF